MIISLDNYFVEHIPTAALVSKQNKFRSPQMEIEKNHLPMNWFSRTTHIS